MKFKILIPKPINIDVDIDRLKKTLYNNDIHYDSITYDGYMYNQGLIWFILPLFY